MMIFEPKISNLVKRPFSILLCSTALLWSGTQVNAQVYKSETTQAAGVPASIQNLTQEAVDYYVILTDGSSQ